MDTTLAPLATHKTLLLMPLFGLLACGGPQEEPNPDPCGLHADPQVQLTPQAIPFAELGDNPTVPLGDPPQGGGPFASFFIRVQGFERNDDGHEVTLSAFNSEEEVRGQEVYIQRFICSNTGPNVGYLVSPPLHVQFHDDLPEDLHGQSIRFHIGIDSLGTSAEAELWGTLDASLFLP